MFFTPIGLFFWAWLPFFWQYSKIKLARGGYFFIILQTTDLWSRVAFSNVGPIVTRRIRFKLRSGATLPASQQVSRPTKINQACLSRL